MDQLTKRYTKIEDSSLKIIYAYYAVILLILLGWLVQIGYDKHTIQIFKHNHSGSVCGFCGGIGTLEGCAGCLTVRRGPVVWVINSIIVIFLMMILLLIFGPTVMSFIVAHFE